MATHCSAHCALRTVWLTVRQNGRVAVTLSARVLYDRLTGIVHVKYVGQAAAPCHSNVFAPPVLSKKCIPN
jgi:hypothetical protein